MNPTLDQLVVNAKLDEIRRLELGAAKCPRVRRVRRLRHRRAA